MDNQQLSINSEIYYCKPKLGYGFIYRYTSPSGKEYIGQTSGTLKKRAKNLISGDGYKKCSLFWKAIRKYGFLNLKVEILEEVPLSELNKKEEFYIQKFDTLAPKGYNLTGGGEGGKKKDVYVYSAQTGCFLEHYSSLTEASLFTEVPVETISVIMNQNHRKQSHNLIFLDNYLESYDISKLAKKNFTRVYVYDKEGFYLNYYDKITEAAKNLKISDSSIWNVLTGRSLHAASYQFSREKVDKMPPLPRNSRSPISVCQIDPKSGEEIQKFPSLSEAARAVGIVNGNNIKRVATSGKGTSGGYFWRIDESSTTKSGQNPSPTVRDSH